MGLFDFIGDIGKKIFSKEEEASAAVTQHINEDNPGVADVAVKVENGVAKISGVASSADALEKAAKALPAMMNFMLSKKAIPFGKLLKNITATATNMLPS